MSANNGHENLVEDLGCEDYKLLCTPPFLNMSEF